MSRRKTEKRDGTKKNREKSIRETCPHFQCGTRQSLVFGWVHQILVLAQFCARKKRLWHTSVPLFFPVWHKFVPAKKTRLKIKFVIFLEIIFNLNQFFETQNGFKKEKRSADRLEKSWHKLVPMIKKTGTSLCQNAFLLQASKPLALPGLAMQLQARFPYALSLVFPCS